MNALAEPEAGTRLDRWLEEAPRPWAEIVNVFFDVAQALASSHASGVAYQEIRIDQIVVGRDGRGRVSDLRPAVTNLPKVGPSGLRTAAAPSVDNRLGEGNSTEAAAYLAPEQIRGRVADVRSNQFSYCVALYRALYRQPPFDHDWAVAEGGPSPGRAHTPLGSIRFDLLVQAFDRKSMIGLAREVLSGNLRPPPHDTDVPSWLDQIVWRGLRPDPEERYASMDELLEEMASHLGDAAKARLTPRGRDLKNWTIAGGVGVFVLLVLAAILVIMFS